MFSVIISLTIFSFFLRYFGCSHHAYVGVFSDVHLSLKFSFSFFFSCLFFSLHDLYWTIFKFLNSFFCQFTSTVEPFLWSFHYSLCTFNCRISIWFLSVIDANSPLTSFILCSIILSTLITVVIKSTFDNFSFWTSCESLCDLPFSAHSVIICFSSGMLAILEIHMHEFDRRTLWMKDCRHRLRFWMMLVCPREGLLFLLTGSSTPADRLTQSKFEL